MHGTTSKTPLQDISLSDMQKGVDYEYERNGTAIVCLLSRWATGVCVIIEHLYCRQIGIALLWRQKSSHSMLNINIISGETQEEFDHPLSLFLLKMIPLLR